MDQNQLYDIQTVEVMQRVLREDSNAIDVGCHAGVMLVDILKFSPAGLHFGFEPLPDLYANLQKKFKDTENVKIRNSALSDHSGVVNFQHVVSNPGYSGLKKRRYDSPDEIVQEIVVQTERMDDVIPPDLKIDFIKIDVEGAELQVLKGAVATIKRSRPAIVFEHGLGAADYYGTMPEQIFDLLVHECGLKCYTMENWIASNGIINLTRSEFADEFRSGRNYYFIAA